MALNGIIPPLPKQSEDRSPPLSAGASWLFYLNGFPPKGSTGSEFRTIDEGSQYVSILS